MAKTLLFPKLQPWQKDVYDQVEGARGTGNIYVVKSKRQVGKSILAAILLIAYAVRMRCISVVIEPTQAQSRRIYKQITDMLADTGLIKSSNSTLLTIEFTNGSEILLKSAEQRDALRGFTVSGLLVIDEGSYIPNDIYEILYACTDANNAPILVISTPLFCSGEFYELYMRGVNGDSRVRSFNWSEYDTSIFLSDEKLEYYRNTVSPLKFKSEYLGEFIAEGSYLFGDINKNIRSVEGKPVYAGIDWGAGNGGDYTVIVFMDDEGGVVDIYAMKDKGPVEQIEIISRLINDIPSLKNVCVEINSIGAVYYDNLKSKTRKHIRTFTTSNDSKRRIIENLIEAFQTDNITIPDDEELKKELQHYCIEKTAKGYTYNGADGVHDDYVIALALAYDTYRKGYSKTFNFALA